MPEVQPTITQTPEQIQASIEKEQAETAKLIVETQVAEANKAAQARANERADEKHAIELAALQVGLDRGRLNLEVEQIVRDRNVREEEMILACDWNHHSYNFSDIIEEESVQQCMTQLNQWVRQNETKQGNSALDIEIVFDSPGGGVFSGMHLFDYIRWVRTKGHNITTVALGSAASMAGILVQAGSTRVIGEESYLLIHKITSMEGRDGLNSDGVRDMMERLEKMQKRIVHIFADRAAKTLVARDASVDYDTKYTETTELIEKHWMKKDWWLDSKEAYEYGFVDIVR